jgi:predicted small integral membrane protein
MNPFGLIFIAMGSFVLIGAIGNWEWFMNHRKAKLVVKILTRKGARIFYGILGSVLIAFGVLILTSVIAMKN